jgi:hypothetical protein
VVLYETGEIRSVENCVMPFPTSGTGVGPKDIALLQLTAPFSTPHGSMILSDASDVILEGENSLTLGFPAYVNTNTVCTSTGGALIHGPPSPVLNVTTNFSLMGEVRFQNDNSVGQSGGPIYYCPANPNNNCQPSNPTYVFGVVSGMNPWGGALNSYNVGAKIPGTMHDWIHSLIPSLP